MFNFCRSAIVTQAITVLPEGAPSSNLSLTAPPPALVPCNTSVEPSVTGNASVVGACDAGPPSLSFVDSQQPGACPFNFTIVRMWVVIDACGARATANQSIGVVDSLSPTLVVPADTSVLCNALSRDPSVTGQATATDNCDPAPAVTFLDTVNGGTDLASIGCPAGGNISRLWTAADSCGNRYIHQFYFANYFNPFHWQ